MERKGAQSRHGPPKSCAIRTTGDTLDVLRENLLQRPILMLFAYKYKHQNDVPYVRTIEMFLILVKFNLSYYWYFQISQKDDLEVKNLKLTVEKALILKMIMGAVFKGLNILKSSINNKVKLLKKGNVTVLRLTLFGKRLFALFGHGSSNLYTSGIRCQISMNSSFSSHLILFNIYLPCILYLWHFCSLNS